MSTLAVNMPRKETDKIIQAALSQDEYQEFLTIREKKDWSDKKLTENIVRLFLKEAKKKPTRINDL